MFCSLFEMENYQAGDLTDVIRATSAAGGGGGGYSYGGAVSSDFSLDPISGDHRLWPHLPADDSVNFGDPLLFPATTRDPFLHQHISNFNFGSDGGGRGGSLAAVAERPCNIFSRMLQISPSSKVGGGVNTTSETAAAGNSPTSTSACGGSAAVASNPLENSGLQISPPRNPAIKRRKSQVKKVVCIPAPAPANGRSSSGEVVPSDLWAWRKYGQKPIKGSPYPRGYYRCSSSKGCSARKQVERSRTDPNMLVITYTSEHNHPWPTQRNALAGSTRSHPSRTTPAPARKTSPKHDHNNNNLASPLTEAAVKGEDVEEDQTTIKAAATAATTTAEDHQDQEGDHHSEYFSYDLIFAEFADQMNGHDHRHHHRHDHHDPAHPLNNVLLYSSSHGFTGKDEEEGSKDPFLELYDWAENNNNQLIGNNYSSNANNLFKEAKGG